MRVLWRIVLRGRGAPETEVSGGCCGVADVAARPIDAMGRAAKKWQLRRVDLIDGVPAMPQPNDLSRSLVALDQNSTIIAVIELSQSSWLVAGNP